MKNYIVSFKNAVKYAVSIIASREFAFIYCTIGTIAQISHTYFLIDNISSLEGFYRTLQALMLSVFISSSLLYFTAISDNAETKESRKIHLAVTLFMVIEILINIYYYSRHLLIDRLGDLNTQTIFDFIFAVIISCLIPVTIKLYSSHIRAKEWLDEIFADETKEEVNLVEADYVNTEEFKELTEEFKQLQETVSKGYFENNSDASLPEDLVNKLTMIDDFDAHVQTAIDKANNDIQSSFKKNSELFFNQFENRIELLKKRNLS